MSFAAVMVVLVSVLMVGGFVLVGHVAEKWAQEIENKVEIEVFLKDSAPKEDVYSIEQKIKAFKEVESIDFVSKKEALEIFKKRNKNNEALISNIPGNPLPASYRVLLKDPHKVSKIATKIGLFSEKETSIEDIKYGKEFVKNLFSFTKLLRLFLFIFITFLGFASLALISNTIRLAIYSRRKEIAIMRLVGASNWFIRWPFLLEGILQGLAGALLAIGALNLVKSILLSNLKGDMNWLTSTLQVSPIFYQNLLLLLLSAGILMGSLGSVIALRRYLKI